MYLFIPLCTELQMIQIVHELYLFIYLLVIFFINVHKHFICSSKSAREHIFDLLRLVNKFEFDSYLRKLYLDKLGSGSAYQIFIELELKLTQELNK